MLKKFRAGFRRVISGVESVRDGKCSGHVYISKELGIELIILESFSTTNDQILE